MSDGELEIGTGDGYIFIMKSEMNGTFKQTHRVPKDVWSQLPQTVVING